MDKNKLNSDTITPIERDTVVESVSPNTRSAAASAPAVLPTPNRARPMQKGRFLLGMLLSGHGIALILAVAAGALQSFGITGRLSLPAVGLCMIIGVMLLGGGFGIMATSAGTYDDDEFERLMENHDASLPVPVTSDGVSDLPAFRSDVEQSVGDGRERSDQAVA